MERSSLPTSSSKVTVECFDPSEVYSAFKPLLLKYLPLRNLHWKSSNRPLRSIKTLHVELTKDGNDNGSAPERRHQIPGLRQTPYVKLYLLRCDDNETYKATCRKQVREWIKSSVQQVENKKGPNNQENHDAFEWLIIHVVGSEKLPAAQPRSSKEIRLGARDSSDSITDKFKRASKSSSNIFEKLRADFNGSSKSAIDRVAQIHVPDAEQPISAEAKDQYQDLVQKLKVTILTSFDHRVRQYEDDIREKDSQRSLPGWNFNTFFILKEGLARGFENVGLFDDALVGYDELALGLEVVVYEQLNGPASDPGTRFLSFSGELKNKVQASLKDTDEDVGENSFPDFDIGLDPAGRLPRREYLLDSNRSPFRDLILANDISIFDFRLYIFCRQLSLLLRTANASSVADQPPAHHAVPPIHEEHYLPLAEVCQRAVDFITRAARTLRHDLELALDLNEPMSKDERVFRKKVVSNFILSWTYVSALQVLAQTGSQDLILPPAEVLPSRPNSFSKLGSLESPSWVASRSPSPSKTNMMRRPSLPRSNSKFSKKTGTEELAGARAELYLLARASVQQIGNDRGWTCQSIITHMPMMEDVPLEAENDSDGEAAHNGRRPAINGLQYLDLRRSFKSREFFTNLFASLTIFGYRHSLAANRTNSAEKALTELAILKFEAGEYEVAASHLGHISAVYKNGQWAALEATLLELYAKCMKHLGRHGEYVSTLLTLHCQSRGYQQSHPTLGDGTYLSDLWAFSEKLTTPMTTKLSDFFSIKALAPNIHHFQQKDGFFIPTEIGFLLTNSTQLPEIARGIEMVISPINDSALPRITLASSLPHLISGPKRIELSSNLSVCGWYAIDTIRIQVGNIMFLQDYKAVRLSPDEQSKPDPCTSLRFFVYPNPRSLQATASPAAYLHLAHPRSILVEMKTGWNEIQACLISMKSGTAGLRLRLHEAKVDCHDSQEITTSTSPNEGAQTIRLIGCPPDSTYTMLIPYTVENVEVPVVSAKLDIEYSTVDGSFMYSSCVAVNTILPISVNVQDIFQANALFSRFTISPATLVPLRLWSCDVQDSETAYRIQPQENSQSAMDVFPKQPASLMYRFTPVERISESKNQVNRLSVAVKFSCLDEVVLKTMERYFTSSIGKSNVSHLLQPLCAHLLSTFRSQWSAQDLEIIGLCHEIEIWPFQDLGWEAVLIGFSVKVRDEARTWLKEWHKENAVIPIYRDLNDDAKVPSRLIVIPVDIPTPSLVLTVSFEIDPLRAEDVTIGEALLIDLQISYTRDWASSGNTSQDEEELDISFEVLAPTENWIIGGMRKGYLTTSEAMRSMPIILLPQRTGHLLLPSVEIKCYKAGTLHSGIIPTEESKVSCEVDLKSHAQSVHVISGLRETVVDLAFEADKQGQPRSEKRFWLAGSKVRELIGTQRNG